MRGGDAGKSGSGPGRGVVWPPLGAGHAHFYSRPGSADPARRASGEVAGGFGRGGVAGVWDPSAPQKPHPRLAGRSTTAPPTNEPWPPPSGEEIKRLLRRCRSGSVYRQKAQPPLGKRGRQHTRGKGIGAHRAGLAVDGRVRAHMVSLSPAPALAALAAAAAAQAERRSACPAWTQAERPAARPGRATSSRRRRRAHTARCRRGDWRRVVPLGYSRTSRSGRPRFPGRQGPSVSPPLPNGLSPQPVRVEIASQGLPSRRWTRDAAPPHRWPVGFDPHAPPAATLLPHVTCRLGRRQWGEGGCGKTDRE